MWAVILLALVATVAAQVPQRCDGPASFTARFRHMDRERNYYVEGKMYFDRINRRMREFEDEDVSHQREYYDKLRLWNQNTEYRVDLKTRKCNVTTPRAAYHPWGVPLEGRYRGSGTIGAVGVPNEEVTVDIFEGKFWDSQDPFFVSVTRPDCFVVEFGVFSNRTGFDHREFYDVVAGITDPEAFVPPRECV